MSPTRCHRGILACLAAVVFIAGCQTQQSPPPAPTGPMREGYYRPRNPYFLPKPTLAMESDEMHRLARAAGEDEGGRTLAWYDMRNDVRITVQAGYQSSRLEVIDTQIYDQQYQYGGQVRDNYSQRTRRSSYQEHSR